MKTIFLNSCSSPWPSQIKWKILLRVLLRCGMHVTLYERPLYFDRFQPKTNLLMFVTSLTYRESLKWFRVLIIVYALEHVATNKRVKSETMEEILQFFIGFFLQSFKMIILSINKKNMIFLLKLKKYMLSTFSEPF